MAVLSPVGSMLTSLSSIANAQNSESSGTSDSWGSSYGASASNAYDNMDAWSLAKANAFEDSESSSWGQSGSYSTVYGREASAQDIQNAAEANKIQRDLWQEQADYNAKQAEIDREFQRQMSNTAYQRAVADLKAAGLNPILAALNMGATTPAGAVASSGLATSHKANAYAQSESSSYSSSGSKAWSHGESESGSASKTTKRSESNSWSKSGSSEGSHSENASKTTTQLKDLINNAGKLITDATTGKDVDKAIKDAKSGTNRNGVVGWQSYKKK